MSNAFGIKPQMRWQERVLVLESKVYIGSKIHYKIPSSLNYSFIVETIQELHTQLLLFNITLTLWLLPASANFLGCLNPQQLFQVLQYVSNCQFGLGCLPVPFTAEEIILHV